MGKRHQWVGLGGSGWDEDRSMMGSGGRRRGEV